MLGTHQDLGTARPRQSPSVPLREKCRCQTLKGQMNVNLLLNVADSPHFLALVSLLGPGRLAKLDFLELRLEPRGQPPELSPGQDAEDVQIQWHREKRTLELKLLRRVVL